MKKITIYTRVYNTERYLRKCLDSIINQTYRDFQHVVIDNGCTDGCTQILKEYAQKYSWVKLIQFEENRRGIDIGEYVDTPYFCQLDSDDWLENTFLEKMVELIESEQADIVATGSYFHFEQNQSICLRSIEKRMSIESFDFAQYYPQYHQIFRTTWAKLYKTEIYYNASLKTNNVKLSYGSDTLTTFLALRQAKKICIDNSALHHYRVHKNSVSYKYEIDRFDSDVYLYEDAKDFLLGYGDISEYNNFFIDAVFANALSDTIKCILGSQLTQKEKLSEFLRISNSAVTIDVFSRKENNGTVAKIYDFFIKTILLEQVTPENEMLFQEVIRSLKSDVTFTDIINFLVRTDTAFFERYRDYIFNITAQSVLNQMTQLLENGLVDVAQNTFYRIYIYLAAYNEKIPEFLFGKIEYAKYLLKNKNKESCQYLIDELKEMNIDNDEIKQLCLEVERL